MTYKMNRVLSVFYVLLSFAVPAVLSAEEYARPTRIWVQVSSLNKGEMSPVGQIIVDAIDLELTLNGFDIVSIENESDYTLRTNQEETGDTMALEIVTYRTRPPKENEIPVITWSGPINRNLDKAVQTLIRQDIIPRIPTTFPAGLRETKDAAQDAMNGAFVMTSCAKPAEAPPEFFGTDEIG